MKKLDMQPSDTVVIVNPNPMIPYRIKKAIAPPREKTGTNAGQRSYSFAPFEQVEAPRSVGMSLVMSARRAWADTQEQAKNERKEWSRRINHQDAFTRDRALQYCDQDGNPRTIPLPFPGLVEMSSAEGQKFLEEGKKLAQELTGDKLKEYTAKYANKIEDTMVVAEAEPQLPETPPEVSGKPTIDRPDAEWEVEQKVEQARQEAQQEVQEIEEAGRKDAEHLRQAASSRIAETADMVVEKVLE